MLRLVVGVRRRDFGLGGLHKGCCGAELREGGAAGKPSAFVRNRGSNREIDLGNTDILTAEPGDRIYIKSAGAGGWGSPWQRDAASVLSDVERGFVSEVKAAEEYGVIIRESHIDEAATAARRKGLVAADQQPFYGFNAHRIAYERIWTRPVYAEMVRIVSKLPVHWRFFVKHKIFEAVGRLAPEQRTGDPRMIAEIFDRLVAEYPHLAVTRSDAAE